MGWWDDVVAWAYEATSDDHLDSLHDKAAAYEYAELSVRNMAEGEWSSEWLGYAMDMLGGVYGATADDATEFWSTLAATWSAAWTSYAGPQGIPHWTTLGDVWASEAGLSIQWETITSDLADSIAPTAIAGDVADDIKGFWDSYGRYVVGIGAVVAGAYVWRSIK